MKAIVQEGSGSADVLHLRDIQRPDLPDDRVLVRVRAASVNALDWHTVHGGRLVNAVGFLLRQPTFPIRGADLSGHVEAVGKNVTRLRPGEAVSARPEARSRSSRSRERTASCRSHRSCRSPKRARWASPP